MDRSNSLFEPVSYPHPMPSRRRDEDLTRPSWWPRWVPIRCPACGQPLLPGRVSISWEQTGIGRTGGHEVWFCVACHHEMAPPLDDEA